MLKLGFIGAGTVGTALAVKLNSSGYQIVTVFSRSRQSAQSFTEAIPGCQLSASIQEVADTAELIFITTPDDVISSVASQIEWRPGQYVVHCSGADSTDILEYAWARGAHTGVFHPLQTFASLTQALENIPGTTFAIEAEEPLLTILKTMATDLQGNWVELKASDKVLYHAAAVISCNYLVTLIKLATDLWQIFNVPPQQSAQALLPLIKGTINNIESVGIPDALTGPIARGDSGTIRKHIAALEKSAPALINTYLDLGLQTIPIALAKGKINQAQAREMESILGQPALTKSAIGGYE